MTVRKPVILGLTGWAAEELQLGRGTWLAWPAVFALFGSVGVAPVSERTSIARALEM